MSAALRFSLLLLLLWLPAGATPPDAARALADLAEAAETELRGNLLPFWLRHVPHPERGGFHGAVGRDGTPREGAPRAALMTSRILWTFSAAYRAYGDPAYRAMAARAYADLTGPFLDRVHGGVFWSLDPAGRPQADFKHVYGQAFAVYALSEYHRATGDAGALRAARALYRLIEERAADPVHGGYHEAFTRDWQRLRPGARTVVGPAGLKSQNTHLHVMEAYANLLRASGDDDVRQSQRRLIALILDRIVDPATGHLGLFFAPDWTPRSSEISYGHDIEFAWLVTEAAAELGDPDLLARVRPLAVRIAEVTLAEGVEPDGGIIYEADASGRPTQPHREWWVPAEAAVGFLNAYQISGDDRFLAAARAQWDYIQRHFVDREHGEWFHSVRPDGTVAVDRPKADGWKCPYHSGRACLELVQRARALGPAE